MESSTNLLNLSNEILMKILIEVENNESLSLVSYRFNKLINKLNENDFKLKLNSDSLVSNF